MLVYRSRATDKQTYVFETLVELLGNIIEVASRVYDPAMANWIF
jgi:hypothetical protein